MTSTHVPCLNVDWISSSKLARPVQCCGQWGCGVGCVSWGHLSSLSRFGWALWAGLEISNCSEFCTVKDITDSNISKINSAIDFTFKSFFGAHICLEIWARSGHHVMVFCQRVPGYGCPWAFLREVTMPWYSERHVLAKRNQEGHFISFECGFKPQHKALASGRTHKRLLVPESVGLISLRLEQISPF